MISSFVHGILEWKDRYVSVWNTQNKYYETAIEMIIPYYCEDYPEEWPDPRDVPSQNVKGQARGEYEKNEFKDTKFQIITQNTDENGFIAKKKEIDKEQSQGESTFPEKKRKSGYTD